VSSCLLKAPRFFSKEDGISYFKWISRLPGFRDLKIAGKHVWVDFEGAIPPEAKKEIEALERRYLMSSLEDYA